MRRLSILLALLQFIPESISLSSPFLACQLQKPAHISPLLGCPPDTLFVSPTDSFAEFTSVQDAILSLPSNKSSTVLIGEGVYNEVVNISLSDSLTLLGQLKTSALEPRSNASTRNLVTIWSNSFINANITHDAQTAVFTISPAKSKSQNASHDNVNFKAYSINLENRAVRVAFLASDANYSISQALVTDITAVNASFYGCTFASYQDTWYTGNNACTYVTDSIIFGQTDYLFGYGTAWFENVTLANRACGGGIVAWQGTSDADAPGNRFGAYISNSRIIRSPDANATLNITEDCYLGRPWNDLAITVYLRSYMDNTIRPAGWTPFDAARPTIMNTTFYAEYDNYGRGSNTSQRVSDHILNSTEAKEFTVDKVFRERPEWIDYTYSP